MTLPSRVLARLAKLPSAHTYEVSVERDVATKMEDGAVLLADRWYPTRSRAGGPPVVLMRSPYGRRQVGIVGRLFAERGYQVLVQSCRGTFGSDGDFDPFHNEQADGRATLEWIAGQPWFEGRVATFGPSYLGLVQWAVAEDPPPYLKAMALDVTAGSFRDSVVYPGGSFALETSLAWLHQVTNQERPLLAALLEQRRTPRVVRKAAKVLPLRDADRATIGRHAGFFQDWLVHEEPGDPWWDPITFDRRLAEVPPASLVGGWYDIFLPRQVADFGALRAAGREARLTIGPWTHASPAGMAEAVRDGLEWFDVHLGLRPERGRPHPVRVFVMGSKRWVGLEDWPPPTAPQPWYLQAGGRLSPAPPSASPADHYHYDPADPAPGIGGPSLMAPNAGRKNQAAREARDDVLVYTSEPLAEELTVIGPLRADLHLRSSVEHTDVFVRLCDVDQKGVSTNIADGIVRLGPADIARGADGVFAVAVDMWPTANTFRRGHQLRLQVSSAAHPLFVRNTGSGERLASASELRPSDHEVLHDPEHASAVILPVGGFG
ncbi:MAG TPA: CocE/NonD family hydrolase [Acidimicrobiales bacterium]|nr:CocE/NonD family hydrolase [Acidimicrobiales bacterium]